MRIKFFAAAALLFGNQAFANTISLSFDTLPSAQGWQFVGSGISETDAFSVDGTTLRQNTMGIYGGGAYYQIPNALDTTQGFSIEVRARILNEGYYIGALAFTVTSPTIGAGILIGRYTTSISNDNGDSLLTFDNTSFHDYRIVVTPGQPYSFFIDNTLVDSGNNPPLNFNYPNLIYFGDVSGGYSGQAEITKYVFQQPALVPLPGAAMFFVTGLIALSRLRKACSS